MKKYSRQREAVLRTLKGVTCHPSAGWIYDTVRKEMPNISLGTVYRNLSELRDSGDIISFTPGDGVERFDGNTKSHYHLFCTACKSLIDIGMGELDNLNRTVSKTFNCEVERHQLMFYGRCNVCKNSIN